VNPSFSAAQLRALGQLVDLWKGGPRFVLVGAAAINCHRPSPRGTHDLDIVIAIPLEELPAGLDRVPGWVRHPKRLHEWRAPGLVSVDLLPAGAELIAAGYIEWSAGLRMSLVGFEHVFARSSAVALKAGLEIQVASLEVLALLKMISYQDRPAERVHDLHDLAFILEEYLEADDMRRWDDDILDMQLPFEDVSAFVLGRDMAGFINERDEHQVRSFLARLYDDRDGTCSRLAALGPPSWERAEENVRARFETFARGLGARRS
jgi:predicted nucleotidyltransferase